MWNISLPYPLPGGKDSQGSFVSNFSGSPGFLPFHSPTAPESGERCQADFARAASGGFASFTCSSEDISLSCWKSHCRGRLVFHELKIKLIKAGQKHRAWGRGEEVAFALEIVLFTWPFKISIIWSLPPLIYVKKDEGEASQCPLRAAWTGEVMPRPYLPWQMKLSVYKTLRSQGCG